MKMILFSNSRIKEKLSGTGIRDRVHLLSIISLGLLLSCKSTNNFSEELLCGDNFVFAEIIIPRHPSTVVELAARELQYYLKTISKLNFEITTETTPGRNHIFVGRSRYTAALDLDTIRFENGSFAIHSGKGWMALIGDDKEYIPSELIATNRKQSDRINEAWYTLTNSKWSNPLSQTWKAYNRELDLWEFDHRGTLNAVYEYLRILGVRWYMPGKIGEVVPRLKNIPLSRLNKKYIPRFKLRRHYNYTKRFQLASKDEILWYARLGLNAGEDFLGHGDFSHGIRHLHSHTSHKQLQTEKFAILNGKRAVEANREKPCLSSKVLFEENVEWARKVFEIYDEPVISVMPPDGFTRCECKQCFQQQDLERGVSGKLSNYVWNYVNSIARELLRSHPTKKVLCFAYSSYLLPPDNIKTLSPNIQVGICRWRSKLKDVESTSEYQALYGKWLKLNGNRPLIMWDYYLHSRPNGVFNGIPVLFTRPIYEDLSYLQKISTGEFIEVYRKFQDDDSIAQELAFNHLNIYITSRLYWDRLPLDTLLRDYYHKFWNPVAREIRELFVFCENNWSSFPTRSELIDEAFAKLDEAEVKGSNWKDKNRILMLRDYMQPLLKLRRSMDRSRNLHMQPVRALRRSSEDLDFDGLINDNIYEGLHAYPIPSKRINQHDRGAHFYLAFVDRGLLLAGSMHGNPVGDKIQVIIETLDEKISHFSINSDGKISLLKKNEMGMIPEIRSNMNSSGWAFEVMISMGSKGLGSQFPNENYPWLFNIARTFRDGKRIYFEAFSSANGSSKKDFRVATKLFAR